jgi:hypothetical protein
MLAGSKVSKSASRNRPTPIRARSTVTLPPMPPRPATATVAERSTCCSVRVTMPMFRPNDWS